MAATAALAIQGITQAAITFASVTSNQLESDFRERQFETNKKIAEAQAEDAIFRGEKEAARLRRRTKKLIGSQRVALAAQGIDIESGSAADILEDTAASSAVDELTIRNNAAREALGFKSQALGFGAQAGFQRISGRFARGATIATGGLRFARDLVRFNFSGSRRRGGGGGGGGGRSTLPQAPENL